ncbi:hypothetical protein COLO4_35933 [Corchorus olitorius]|uniref:F-box associated beta-propeller type 3 domain-containing protein n=1 Tax=Corchorus olitorius TaxID=93759 RepID=A0A1R3GBR3_9ROSI|nr:hypothetical protein COLO4_35933 [Corchorus olitorius]
MDNRTILLSNIATGDYKLLPDHDDDQIDEKFTSVFFNSFHGVGYDSINDYYKVVRVEQMSYSGRTYDSHLLISETKVYSLKVNKWRKGEEIRYQMCNYPGEKGTFVKGALRWVSIKEIREWDSTNDFIIALDVGTENITKWSCSTTCSVVQQVMDS